MNSSTLKNPMKPTLLASLCCATTLLATACSKQEEDHSQHDHPHPHPAESAAAGEGEEDDEHVEVAIGSATIGDLEVALAQGHGGVAAGKESHLILKLPTPDDGSTIVRAWIGTQDRTLSYVGKGEYSRDHGEYDIHATAPDPLPENTLWWIEIEQPDGATSVGSAEPLFE